MTSPDEILALEREFWTTMAAGEHRNSAAHLASHAASIRPDGTMTFTPEEYVKMGETSGYEIKDWSFSDEKVVFPTPESAICTYMVRQTVQHEGKTETTTNQDTSIWVNEGTQWKCILHSEIPVEEVAA